MSYVVVSYESKGDCHFVFRAVQHEVLPQIDDKTMFIVDLDAKRLIDMLVLDLEQRLDVYTTLSRFHIEPKSSPIMMPNHTGPIQL